MNMLLRMLFLSALMAMAYPYHASPVPLDGLPWTASRAEFVKRFPDAREVFAKQSPARDTFIVVRPDVPAVDGHPVESLMRTFVGDKGCAVALGFGQMTAKRANQLTAALKRHHQLLLRERNPTPDRQVAFMSDEDARIAIAQQRDSETPGRVSVSYLVVLRSCPVEVPKDYQVIAPPR